MEAVEAILTRRSIRRSSGAPVPEKLVETILEAAMSAPSARDERPWHFIVIDSRKTLDMVMAAHPHAQMLKAVPMAILVCGDLSLEKSAGYWPMDCSAATMSILLAVRYRGSNNSGKIYFNDL